MLPGNVNIRFRCIQPILLLKLVVFTLASMINVAATAVYSELFYSGIFEKPTFELLGSPPALYEALLKNLGVYGASLPGLKLEVTSLADANLSCNLPTLHGLLRVRLDRFDFNFVPFHDVGADLGGKALIAGWDALKIACPVITLREHAVSFNSTARLRDSNYDELMANFVRLPEGFPTNTKTAAGFYLAPDAENGTRNFNIIIERALDPQSFSLRMDLTVESAKVDVHTIAEFVSQYVTRHFDMLGIRWES